MPDAPDAQARVLEAAARKGVSLDVLTFSESTHTAAQAAAAIGAEVAQIVKSVVFVAPAEDGQLTPYLVLASGANRVDLRRLAAVLGQSAIRRASADEVRRLTGFPIGGVPPIGHGRPIRTVMDPDLGRFRLVWAAAGTANAVFSVPPATLRSLANAVVAPIGTDTPTASRGVPVGPGRVAHAVEGQPAGAASGA